MKVQGEVQQASAKVAVAGYVLAGGASRRFGEDKALVELGGQTVLTRMCEVVRGEARPVRVIAAPDRYSGLGEEVIADRWPGEGPLGGVVTALRATRELDTEYEWNLIVSCDMPFLTCEWLRFMVHRALTSAVDVVVPESQHGLEPLCACWRTAAVNTLQVAFETGVRKVSEGMKRLRMEVLDEKDWKRFDTAGRLFWNMNTAEDYQAAIRILGA